MKASQTAAAAASDKGAPHNSSKNLENPNPHSNLTITTSSNVDFEITGISCLIAIANANRKNMVTTMTSSTITSYNTTSATVIDSVVHADT
ncbi:hypothetical protein NC652_006623 [Populus alba x Populus x berolinensis]|nr:hypothetical protein NC652_006623 [Populus alba x Populus x berolinensis]